MEVAEHQTTKEGRPELGGIQPAIPLEFLVGVGAQKGRLVLASGHVYRAGLIPKHWRSIEGMATMQKERYMCSNRPRDSRRCMGGTQDDPRRQEVTERRRTERLAGN